MTELRRPRHSRPGKPKGIARHGRLGRRHPFAAIGKIVAGLAIVASVSAFSLAGMAVGDVVQSTKPSVDLVDQSGHTETKQEGIDAIKGSFNVLLAGSDSGDGNPAYGDRGENLNDVTMLMHVSADHQHVTVVSFPRDMLVPIPSCPNGKGGYYSAMSSQKINVTLSYGGLACTVLTVEQLTGLSIPYAALIQFDGVIQMSDAVGGVPVCLAGAIDDPYVGLKLSAGEHVIKGAQALAFLRTRHGVGDGSDLGRISNQQVFLSSLVRTIRSADTLGNPLKVYALAKAAASNMQLSTSLSNIKTMASMAVALRNADLSNIVFVQYPTDYVDDGSAVEPDEAGATALMSALQKDEAVQVTGGTGVGSVAGGAASKSSSTPTPTATSSASASASPTPSSSSSRSSSATSTPTPSSSAVALPSQVHGQSADEYTCSKPFGD
ncbi:LCP family protein [Gryllotalpicola ginsengisoli]|uniref:LCP family protein n=1 Tax=Gryllotalpicola ginsengisoli TaxID=444608 RepID=UPI0003FF18F1|nr:LCP family protein [Gryllotalpicola ginsengisoli]